MTTSIRRFRRHAPDHLAAKNLTQSVQSFGVNHCIGVALLLAVLSGTSPNQASAQNYITSNTAAPPPSAAKNLCAQLPWACAMSKSGAQITPQQMTEIERINRRINRTVKSVSDERQYQTEDLWALPTSMGGDCEDFTLIKKREILSLGVPPERLLIATVFDRKRGPHAVLVLRTQQGDFLLDNLTNKIMPWSKSKYTFLRMQNPEQPKHWVSLL